MISGPDRELLNMFLDDPDFIKNIEDEIGMLTSSIEINWMDDHVTFYGVRKNKIAKISELLVTLREVMRLQ